jgi:predicted metal-binding protein
VLPKGGEASMKGRSPFSKFVNRACELGAVNAKVIRADSIVTAPWVRMKCQFGCGGFNSSFCCPPHSPKPEETREVIACYRRALLIHCKGDVRPTKIVVKLEREIFLAGYYKAFGLGAGPCRLCKTCSLKECVRPDDARPSMEACGIDVFATARANGFPIEVVRDYSCDENRYGVVLIE